MSNLLKTEVTENQAQIINLQYKIFTFSQSVEFYCERQIQTLVSSTVIN